ncbi:pilus assembly protein PilZ [Spirochaetia bacterium]|nr:pilus assembly protein PilZ [Spirochaetia bacterium]
MIFLTLLTIAFAVGLVIFLLFRSKKEQQGSWIEFFAKGKDSGFSFKETELLQQLALKCKLSDPNALFRSAHQLDTCIRSLLQGMQDSPPGYRQVLSKLYDFRQRLEIEKSRNQGGIKSSQGIGEAQALRILVKGMGVFKSGVIKNTSRSLTISRPVNIRVEPGFSWKGLKIVVYFWRENDAAYVFDSEVEDEAVSMGVSSLRISHSDSLFRTQKRKSLRIKTHRAAYLYLMGVNEKPGRIEQAPGLRCLLEDISDSGCAVIVGGKAAAGLHIKVQFVLDNTLVCMSGRVRAVDFAEDGSRSVLHVEADTLPVGTRNRIFGEVFGMLSEGALDDFDEGKKVI